MGIFRIKMAGNKTIYRINKTENYVIINRHLLEDPQLSYEARGLLSSMLAKPNDWVFYISYFIKNSPAGRDKVRRIFNELIKFGYIVKSEHRSEKGHFSAPQYIVYEFPLLCDSSEDNVPKTENPSTVNPSPDKPSPSIHPLLSKQTELKKQVTKNTTTNNQKYIWSPKLSERHKNSILTLLEEVDDYEAVQLLLDELAGQIDNIKNPVGYFRTLLQSYLLGEFTPAKALQIQSSREQKLQNESVVERSRKYHEEQLNQQINIYTKN